ncbi:hypothetical protein SKAU_G00216000 [Synaphobranchus kaupii]|uniref:Uncharacterized protein n=1 Tax=Synaphobranchus kaupii TaxID=118154 RepID=A0A9Q1IVJ2_SYNKA|nr:hypothetical protein SKAU_G00216000 [Synaphobranchus kaupii]
MTGSLAGWLARARDTGVSQIRGVYTSNHKPLRKVRQSHFSPLARPWRTRETQLRVFRPAPNSANVRNRDTPLGAPLREPASQTDGNELLESLISPGSCAVSATQLDSGGVGARNAIRLRLSGVFPAKANFAPVLGHLRARSKSQPPRKHLRHDITSPQPRTELHSMLFTRLQSPWMLIGPRMTTRGG